MIFSNVQRQQMASRHRVGYAVAYAQPGDPAGRRGRGNMRELRAILEVQLSIVATSIGYRSGSTQMPVAPRTPDRAPGSAHSPTPRTVKCFQQKWVGRFTQNPSSSARRLPVRNHLQERQHPQPSARTTSSATICKSDVILGHVSRDIIPRVSVLT